MQRRVTCAWTSCMVRKHDVIYDAGIRLCVGCKRSALSRSGCVRARYRREETHLSVYWHSKRSLGTAVSTATLPWAERLRQTYAFDSVQRLRNSPTFPRSAFWAPAQWVKRETDHVSPSLAEAKKCCPLQHAFMALYFVTGTALLYMMI